LSLERLNTFAEWAHLPPGAGEQMRASGWRTDELHDRGQLSAIAVVLGTEIHFAVSPKRRGGVIRRHRVAEFLRPHFDRLGFLTTRTYKATKDEVRFLERLGFEHLHKVGDIDHYMLTALPFERKGD
jgi:GNAT superfamily N-acetyltransferase